MGPKASIIVLLSSFLVLSACDIEESSPSLAAEAADLDETTDLGEFEIEPTTFDWDLVPQPAIPGIALGLAYEGPEQIPATYGWNIDTFYFFTNPDFVSVTQAVGGLFAPSPVGTQALPPELADGFLLGFTFRDLSGDTVGFGSIQEVVDFESAAAQTHYMLTIPGRGTLMLGQEENNDALFAELFDMIAEQDFVRSYNPPLVFINTVPGTNRVIGGTGEFGGSNGIWREYAIVNEFNLLTGVHDVGNIVQIVTW
jgi:hypothetical protein